MPVGWNEERDRVKDKGKKERERHRRKEGGKKEGTMQRNIE